jgi:hypothetical protein
MGRGSSIVPAPRAELSGPVTAMDRALRYPRRSWAGVLRGDSPVTSTIMNSFRRWKRNATSASVLAAGPTIAWQTVCLYIVALAVIVRFCREWCALPANGFNAARIRAGCQGSSGRPGVTAATNRLTARGVRRT